MVERVLHSPGGATEATLATLLTSAQFAAEDFATETTLAAALVLLGTIDADTSSLAAEDFATEATLASLLTSAQFAAEDFATQATLEAARVLLAALEGKDYATQTTLATLLTETGWATRIGEVQATPTPNTVLARLKEINDSLGSLSVTADFAGDEADLDSGAGTDEHEVVAIGLPGSGGHVVGGTATNPIRTDPTGTTVQPVSGEVALDARVDIFKHLITVTPFNQVEMRLDAADWQTFTDEAVAGGGSISQANGLVTLATSTGTTGSATLSSADEVEYRAGVGVFGGGTTVFTPGVADSYQRAGISTDLAFTNGVSFGYEGTTFGIRYTRGGVQQLFVAQADWDDPCLGGAGSAFTRDGALVALDPTAYGGPYFIQCGLFGFAGWVASVWSPDEGFIPVYTYKHSGTAPVFESNSFKVVLRATKTAGASNLSMSGQCWVAGTYSNLRRIGDDSLTERDLALTMRAVITGETTAGGGGFVNVKVNPSGTLASDGLTDAELRAADVKVTLDGEQVALDAATLTALETIGLDAATLAALENVAITNFPADYPDAAVLAKVEAVRALLAGTLTVTGTVSVNEPVTVDGTVALDAGTLAALETIGLDAATLAALETISIANFPSDYPDAAVLAKVEAVRALLAGTLTVGGTVAISNPTADPETGLAKDATLTTEFGTDGATPPAVLGAGTGVRGWLRSIYEKLTGTLSVADNADEFWRILNKRYLDTEEALYDIPTSLVSASIYTGVAPDGTLTSAASWTVVRAYFDANGNPSRHRIRFGVVWDNRTAGWT